MMSDTLPAYSTFTRHSPGANSEGWKTFTCLISKSSLNVATTAARAVAGIVIVVDMIKGTVRV